MPIYQCGESNPCGWQIELSEDNAELNRRIAALEAENAELLASLCEMVRQNCSRNGDDLVSYSLPANAIAMRVLKKHGLLMFSDEAGRVITAQWVSTPEWHQLDQQYGWMIDGVKP